MRRWLIAAVVLATTAGLAEDRQQAAWERRRAENAAAWVRLKAKRAAARQVEQLPFVMPKTEREQRIERLQLQVEAVDELLQVLQDELRQTIER